MYHDPISLEIQWKKKKGKKYSRNGICSNAAEVGKFWGDSIWR